MLGWRVVGEGSWIGESTRGGCCEGEAPSPPPYPVSLLLPHLPHPPFNPTLPFPPFNPTLPSRPPYPGQQAAKRDPGTARKCTQSQAQGQRPSPQLPPARTVRGTYVDRIPCTIATMIATMVNSVAPGARSDRVFTNHAFPTLHIRRIIIAIRIPKACEKKPPWIETPSPAEENPQIRPPATRSPDTGWMW